MQIGLLTGSHRTQSHLSFPGVQQAPGAHMVRLGVLSFQPCLDAGCCCPAQAGQLRTCQRYEAQLRAVQLLIAQLRHAQASVRTAYILRMASSFAAMQGGRQCISSMWRQAASVHAAARHRQNQTGCTSQRLENSPEA